MIRIEDEFLTARDCLEVDKTFVAIPSARVRVIGEFRWLIGRIKPFLRCLVVNIFQGKFAFN